MLLLPTTGEVWEGVRIMKILVLNCGSSSIKYALYNMDDQSVITSGGIEKI